MSEHILVKVDGGWTDNPIAIATSLAAMANKDHLQAQLIAALEAEIARLRKERLTAGEREALELSLELEWPRTAAQLTALARCLGPVCIVPENHYKASVRAFLERQPLSPGPETKEEDDVPIQE